MGADAMGTGGSHRPTKEETMATGETGFDDVTFDLISVQYHSLKAGHDYGQYVRDAENAEQKEIADFFREVMQQDSDRAHRCHEFLAQLGGTDNTAPQSGSA
jgi:bacterioferritin (cytochrome b1)